MALPAPEETLMGVTQYNPRKKQAPVVPIRVERREPPKVLKMPGMTEWVGTQKPTEQQDPAKLLAAKPPTYQQYMDKNYGKGWEDGITVGSYEKTKKDYKKYVKSHAAYNTSAKTYNEAIGSKTPAQNRAIAERLLNKTQPKTVMA